VTRAPQRALSRRVTRSERETVALGERLGRLLAPGDVVALRGELGAGKTQFVRGACRGAGVPRDEVASPSFAIVATYRGRLPVHHADLYRVADYDELYGTGFCDLVGREGATLVEWADRVPEALPDDRLEILLSHDPRRPSARRLEIVGTGARHAALARALGRPRRRPRAARQSPRRPEKRGAGRRGRGPSEGPRPRGPKSRVRE